jgi:hypothetical protein
VLPALRTSRSLRLIAEPCSSGRAITGRLGSGDELVHLLAPDVPFDHLPLVGVHGRYASAGSSARMSSAVRLIEIEVELGVESAAETSRLQARILARELK